MKKGFSFTYDKRRKDTPWRLKVYGDKQQVSYFNFGSGKPKLTCVKCGVTHWKDLEVFKPRFRYKK